MRNVIENASNDILFYDCLTDELKTSKNFLLSKRKISSGDLDAYLENKLLNLRSPGTYNFVADAFALPPKTKWVVNRNKSNYTYFSESQPKLVPIRANLQTIEKKALAYLKKYSNSPIAVECSGGLDSSIVIEFLLNHGFDVRLSGFVSDRYEFRTERKVQEYYFNKVNSPISLSYEEYGAFDDLKLAPLHPLPAQESLSHRRHQVAAEATLALNSPVLLSGEAGDQLLGTCTSKIIRGKNAPVGYYYWSLAEKWSDQFVYQANGINYISALAVRSLPLHVISMRAGLNEDHMKIWARTILADQLPDMLSRHAYKAFHDGWVMDGLVAVLDDIAELAKISYDYLGHPELHPQILVKDSLSYKAMSNDLKIRYLGKLAFVTWIFGLARENRLL